MRENDNGVAEFHIARFRSAKTRRSNVGKQYDLFVRQFIRNIGEVGLGMRNKQVFRLRTVNSVSETPTAKGFVARLSFTATANLTVKRHKHDATLLADGTVLIVGGSDERDSRGAYTSVEIYNPKTKTFAKIGEMNLSRYKLNGTTVLLKNGKLLIAGGADRAEVFDPAAKTFEVTAGEFETARLFATATLLQDRRVLIVGGYDNSNAVSSKVWIYKS